METTTVTNPTDAERARALVAASCGRDHMCKTPPCECVDDIAQAIASARREGYRQGQEDAAKLCDENAGLHRKHARELIGEPSHAAAKLAHNDEFLAAAIRALPITGADNG